MAAPEWTWQSLSNRLHLLQEPSKRWTVFQQEWAPSQHSSEEEDEEGGARLSVSTVGGCLFGRGFDSRRFHQSTLGLRTERMCSHREMVDRSALVGAPRFRRVAGSQLSRRVLWPTLRDTEKTTATANGIGQNGGKVLAFRARTAVALQMAA